MGVEPWSHSQGHERERKRETRKTRPQRTDHVRRDGGCPGVRCDEAEAPSARKVVGLGDLARVRVEAQHLLALGACT
jgi:hypothetical protein